MSLRHVSLLLTTFLLPFAAFAAAPPDFGPNVFVFAPTTHMQEMQDKIDHIYTQQQHSEFGAGRFAFLFLPGEYKLDIPVGFYTQVLGLGSSPDAVHVTGNVHADASLPHNNATCTFWRSAENFSVTPTENNTLRWAVSQAVTFRRMHVLGNMVLHQDHGWASGGWMSDTKVDGNVASGSQQQWFSRNVEWKSWTGSNWNMVFLGALNAPPESWPQPPYTVIANTPVIREKPFLQVDSAGNYSVRVPTLARERAGYSWRNGPTPGQNIPLNRFYIAHPDVDTAATINAALARGKNLLLTPGTYDLSEPIHVLRKHTVVFGLGFATLHPTQGTAAMTLADADGIVVFGLLFEAGETRSPVMLRVGDNLSKTSHRNDPISLHDIFFRVGGAAVGKTIGNLEIDSDDVIVDHTWIWRADHGQGVGWTSNLSDNGLVVNGNDVTAYGLFVEHHQQYQVLWNGERGRTYFYQSEIPYDPPTPLSWTDATGSNGWASYKVSASVKEHEAWGLGIYSVFRHPGVTLARAIEAPERSTVCFHHMITVALDNLGEITHIINDAGAPATTKQPRVDPKLDTYPLPATKP